MNTEMIHPMVMKAARVLNRLAAKCCNTDEDDSWRVYGPDFIADAQAALTECGALECLEALERLTEWNARRSLKDNSIKPVKKQDEEIQQAMNAIAKARGTSADQAHGSAP